MPRLGCDYSIFWGGEGLVTSGCSKVGAWHMRRLGSSLLWLSSFDDDKRGGPWEAHPKTPKGFSFGLNFWFWKWRDKVTKPGSVSGVGSQLDGTTAFPWFSMKTVHCFAGPCFPLFQPTSTFIYCSTVLNFSRFFFTSFYCFWLFEVCFRNF